MPPHRPDRRSPSPSRRPSAQQQPTGQRPHQRRQRPPRREAPVPDEDAVDPEQLALFNDIADEVAVPWNEDKTRFQEVLILQGETYQPSLLFDVPPINAAPNRTPDNHIVYSPNRRFGYMNRLLRRGRGLPVYQNHREGIVLWSTDVVIPVLFDGLTRDVWMSLTPMEILSEREGLSLAKGTVLIGGLGLGHFLQKVCAKQTVERVILVEQSQELLDWYGTRLCREQPKVTDVICGDVYEVLPKFGPETRCLLDIWPQYGDAAADARFQAEKQRFKHLWGWGDYLIQPESDPSDDQ